jgi:hypothetical protein
MYMKTEAYLDTSNVAVARTVEFAPSTHLTSGSSQKAHQAIRLVKSVFRQNLNCTVMQRSASVVIMCHDVAEADVLRVCAIAEQKLERLQREPLTAKMVEEILAISSAERRRWSKDGRLRTAGNALFSQGTKQVSVFVYASETIRELVARPDEIADWRRRDGGIPAFHREPSQVR